jgi:hypothetical protein
LVEAFSVRANFFLVVGLLYTFERKVWVLVIGALAFDVIVWTIRKTSSKISNFNIISIILVALVTESSFELTGCTRERTA